MLATSISFEMPAVFLWVAGAIGTVVAALLAIIVWFVRWALTRNEPTHRDLARGHRDLQNSVQRLLEGNVEWVRSMSEHVNRTNDKIDQVRRELTSESRTIDRQLALVVSRLREGGGRGDR